VTYNYGRFLPRALESALAQDYPPERLEVVVVDDGSTDDTPQILADYMARFPDRIRAFRQENAGYVAATNRAFSEARGELWAFLDADDLWPPAKTRTQVDIFESHPQVGAVYGDLEIIDGDDRVVRPSHWAHEHIEPLEGPGCLAPLISNINVAGASSIMVRSALKERFAPVPVTVPYVDWWTVMQVAAVAELRYVLTPRVGYRVHGNNLTFGATGMVLARERIKQTLTRRASIIHGAAAALPAEALGSAWMAVERDAVDAVQAAGTVFVDLPRPDSEQCARAARLANRARALKARNRLTEAKRTLLVAAAEDPYSLVVRAELGSVFGSSPEPSAAEDIFENARSFVVLARLSELVASPPLLAAFCAAFAPDEQVTLFVHAPGAEAADAGAEIRRLFASAEVEEAESPHVVVQPDAARSLEWDRLAELADLTLGADSVRLLRPRYDEAVSSVMPSG
jgi:hypothetical protein